MFLAPAASITFTTPQQIPANAFTIRRGLNDLRRSILFNRTTLGRHGLRRHFCFVSYRDLSPMKIQIYPNRVWMFLSDKQFKTLRAAIDSCAYAADEVGGTAYADVRKLEKKIDNEYSKAKEINRRKAKALRKILNGR